MIGICKICGNEFEKSVNNQICCSDKCSKINNSLLKKQSFLRLKDEKNRIINDYSGKYLIPKRYVLQYGIKFLDDNPNVRDCLRLITKVGGHYTFLTEEEKEIRRKIVKEEGQLRGNNKAKEKRIKRGWIEKNCKVCGSVFTIGEGKEGNNRVTCSDECSKELQRIQKNESSKRWRAKKKNQLK
jgi:predicted nucleic acid-binding Zn ribbon protein